MFFFISQIFMYLGFKITNISAQKYAQKNISPTTIFHIYPCILLDTFMNVFKTL